jgi:atypical dual specificity phosphatase
MLIEDKMSFIKEGLFLCGIDAVTPFNLAANGITLVINVMSEPTKFFNGEELNLVQFPTIDSPSTNIYRHLHPAADLIHSTLKSGGRVVVHCRAGVSRSASIVIAYLIKYYQMSLLEAYNYVKSKRYSIRPNEGFFEQLIDFEVEITASEPSVKMVLDGWHTSVPEVYEESPPIDSLLLLYLLTFAILAPVMVILYFTS